MSEIFSKILKDKNGKVLNVGSKYTQPEWGSEVAEVEILPQTAFGADTMSGTGWALSSPLLKSLEADKEYVVKYNGEEYTCTAFEVAYGDGINVVCIGNGSELGDYGADVPFLLIEYPKTIGESEGVYGEIGSIDGSTYMTISIKAVEETIHKLPSKYVEGGGAAGGSAGGGAFVVELLMDENFNLSVDKTFDEILEATKTQPVIITMSAGCNTSQFSYCCNYPDDGSPVDFLAFYAPTFSWSTVDNIVKSITDFTVLCIYKNNTVQMTQIPYGG